VRLFVGHCAELELDRHLHIGWPNPSSTPSGFKALLVGLIDKSSEDRYHQGVPYPPTDLSDVAAQSPAMVGIVVNATWEQLEPSQGQFDFSLAI